MKMYVTWTWIQGYDTYKNIISLEEFSVASCGGRCFCQVLFLKKRSAALKAAQLSAAAEFCPCRETSFFHPTVFSSPLECFIEQMTWYYCTHLFPGQWLAYSHHSCIPHRTKLFHLFALLCEKYQYYQA